MSPVNYPIHKTITNVKNIYGRLVIDEGARVVNAQSQPIIDLYATGETASNYNIVHPTAYYYGRTCTVAARSAAPQR